MKIFKFISEKIVDLKNWFIKTSLLVKILIVVGLIVIIWFFISKVSSGKSKTTYQTSKVEKGTIVSSVSASGSVLSVNVMSANTKATGIVKTVYVKDGDIVKKGDKILEIDLDFQGQQKYSSAWASYQSAKNNLDSAKTSLYTLQSDMFSKWKSFYDLSTNSTFQNSDGSPNYTNRALAEFHISEDNWLATEAKYKQQQAVIAQAQTSLNSSYLEYTQTMPTITAPTDGTITSLMYAPGMTIGSLDTGSSTSNEKVATIKTEGNPIVKVNLSEIDVSKVVAGQKATITLDSIEDKTFTGKVIGVDTIGETSSNVTQYPSIISLDTSSKQILPNMTITADIIISSKSNILLVPSEAIQTQNNQTYANVLVNNKSQLVPVVTGLTSDSQTEIVSGLKEGQVVITGTTSSSSSGSSSSSKKTTTIFGTSGIGGMSGGGGPPQ
jgi:multidrug efflux pump subunit AcrA (membrane-fusion protein)